MDRLTDGQTDQRTNGLTKRGVESRSTRLKKQFQATLEAKILAIEGVAFL